MKPLTKPLFERVCTLSECIIPDGFDVDQHGVFMILDDTTTKKRIARKALWVAQTVLHLKTLNSLTTIAYTDPMTGTIRYLTVLSDTFHSYTRMRKRVLNHIDIQVEQWSLSSLLRYIRLCELNCSESYTTDDNTYFDYLRNSDY